MKKDKFVYVVIEKWFYNNNGVDTAGAINCTDINIMKTLDLAKELVQSKMSVKTFNNGVVFEEYTSEFENNPFATITKVWHYYQPNYGTSNIRYGYVIQKQKIMDY